MTYQPGYAPTASSDALLLTAYRQANGLLTTLIRLEDTLQAGLRAEDQKAIDAQINSVRAFLTWQDACRQYEADLRMTNPDIEKDIP